MIGIHITAYTRTVRFPIQEQLGSCSWEEIDTGCMLEEADSGTFRAEEVDNILRAVVVRGTGLVHRVPSCRAAAPCLPSFPLRIRRE